MKGHPAQKHRLTPELTLSEKNSWRSVFQKDSFVSFLIISFKVPATLKLRRHFTEKWCTDSLKVRSLETLFWTRLDFLGIWFASLTVFSLVFIGGAVPTSHLSSVYPATLNNCILWTASSVTQTLECIFLRISLSTSTRSNILQRKCNDGFMSRFLCEFV